MRAALISIELFALYILENTPQLSPEAGGVKPLFLVAAALSLTSDEVTAATIYGAVCGVLTDLESGAVGFFAVTLTVMLSAMICSMPTVLWMTSCSTSM